jgi:hypothetical protein
MIKTADRKVDAAENTGGALNLITAAYLCGYSIVDTVASAAVNQWMGSAAGGRRRAAGLRTRIAALYRGFVVATQKITHLKPCCRFDRLTTIHNHQNSSLQ